MNPVVFETGSIVVRHYTAWVSGGILGALAVIAWRAYRHDSTAVTAWLDVGIAAVLGGIVGARVLHVAIEWDYFTDHRDEIRLIRLGGLAWHGALLGGIPAGLVVARLRRVPLRPWMDAAALGWPLGLMAAWIACRQAGCAYGPEVRTLADFPAWQAEELPDVYGLVEPRLDLQLAGAVFGGILLALALLLTWRNWLPGVRLWLILALTGLGMHLLGYFRDDPAHTWYDRRADQVLDLVVLLFSTVIGCTIWLINRRTESEAESPPPRGEQSKEETYENQAGIGPDQTATG